MRLFAIEKEQNYYSQYFDFVFYTLFTSNFIEFVNGVARIFLAPGVQVPSLCHWIQGRWQKIFQGGQRKKDRKLAKNTEK